MIAVDLILTPTDHYVVRPKSYSLIRSSNETSGFVFALSTIQSQELREVIDKHDTGCLAAAATYAAKKINAVYEEQAFYRSLQQDFIAGIHLVIGSSLTVDAPSLQEVRLVVPTLTGIESWKVGTLQDVLAPRKLNRRLPDESADDHSSLW